MDGGAEADLFGPADGASAEGEQRVVLLAGDGGCVTPLCEQRRDGRVERGALGPFDALEANHVEYHNYLRGDFPRPATTLADCRPFVALNSLAYVSSRTIREFPPEAVVPVRDEKEQLDYLNVPHLPAAQEQFLEHGVWPGETRWGRTPGEVATMSDLPRFGEVVRAMARN